MVDQAAKDAAMKTRIITHMNADHQISLSYYLQHFCSLSSSAASKPVLVDITLSSLSIRSRHGEIHTIPLSPPMASFADARTRTVEMDKTARSALDISDIRITKYEPPSSAVHITVFGLCLWTFVIFGVKGYVKPGTFFYDDVLKYFPGGGGTFVWIAGKIAWLVVVLHSGEAFMLDRTRLRKYGVQRGSGLWWKWMSSCFVEGWGCFQRIDKRVGLLKTEKEGKSH